MSKRDCIFVVLDMQRLAVRPCCCRVTTPERREVRILHTFGIAGILPGNVKRFAHFFFAYGF